VIGTDNVLTGAIEMGIKKVICLYKAAYPFNAMGIIKGYDGKVCCSQINNSRFR
jgi:UDP-N-acetylglucosamine 4,6-dehydratase